MPVRLRVIALLVAMLLPLACQGIPLVETGTRRPEATGPTAPAARAGGSLRYGLTLPVSGIDPHIHASSELGIALSSVYDTLVAQAADGSFHPYLAQGWTISADAKSYTFVLRQDVTFHDGTPFDAQAVVRNLTRIADPATRSQKAVFLLGPYERAEAVDRYTVKILLKEPYAPLLDGLSQVYLGMASPAALDQWGDQYQLHQVGTGAFRFVSYQERQTLVIERNPDYLWAPDIRQHTGPAYLERVEFRFFPDPAARLPALLSKQADVMGELPPQDGAQLAANREYQLLPVAVPGQSQQFFMNTRLPPFDDGRVRQALLYGTDRNALVQAVFGPQSPVAYGPLAATTRGADARLKELYAYNPERARALLAEAGWTERGPDGILRKGEQRLALKGILMTWGELAKVGTILQAEWRTLGVDLQLETMSYPAALEAGHKGEHHLMPFLISGTDPSLLRSFFHSQNLDAFNWSKVSDPELDAWLDQAGRLEDRSQRSELYAKVQRRVMEQAWILPIRDPVNLNAASARVQDITFDVQGWFPVLYDTWLTQAP